jgi:hypothetical protein
MATKAQPRRWQPPDLDDFGSKAQARVDQMSFDLARITDILAGARRSDPPEGWRGLVERKVRDNAWLLEMETEFDERPTVPQIEAALTQVRDLARGLYKALHDLDSESCRELSRTLPNPWGDSHWRQVEKARREPAPLYLAAKSALRGLPQPDSTRFAVKRAISRLADVWEILTECPRPGRQNRESFHDGGNDVYSKIEATGPFAELVELALRPALPMHSRSFDRAIREGLKLPPLSSWT